MAARTNIPAVKGPSPYGVAGVEVQAVAAAADVANGNITPHPGRGLLILAFNTGGALAHVTITSVADDESRVGDVLADPILAGQAKLYGPFPSSGWKNAADGGLWFSADAATVKFTPVALDQRGL